MPESVRAFVAVELSDTVKDRLWELEERLQTYAASRSVRWVDPWETHVTLKFLGEVAIRRLPAIVEALDRVAEERAPFALRLADLGAFPNVFHPSVLWVGIAEGREALADLAEAVDRALEPLGFKPEQRPFSPHVTIARVKREASPQQRREIGELVGPTPVPDFPPVTISHISLMRSLLSPGGSRYVRLGRSPLGEAAPLRDDDWEDIE